VFTQILILIIGLALLYFGSVLLVEGAASTAMMFAVRPVIVGLTIVSLATSAPELLVSLVAAFKGSGGISLGNIIGSNVINITLVLGISALIKPVLIKRQIIAVELPYLLIITMIFWILCFDGHIGRTDGIILLSLLIIFLIYGVLTAKEKDSVKNTSKPKNKDLFKNVLYILAGILLLSYGANFVVQEAILIAQQFGLSQTFIGISVVAFGTSLPELATSTVAAAKGESDISVGNVVGSNLFNICLVIGTVGLFNPMNLEMELHYFQFPFLLFITILLGFIAFKNKGVGKRSGSLFIVLFVVYIIVSYIK